MHSSSLDLNIFGQAKGYRAVLDRAAPGLVDLVFKMDQECGWLVYFKTPGPNGLFGSLHKQRWAIRRIEGDDFLAISCHRNLHRTLNVREQGGSRVERHGGGGDHRKPLGEVQCESVRR